MRLDYIRKQFGFNLTYIFQKRNNFPIEFLSPVLLGRSRFAAIDGLTLMPGAYLTLDDETDYRASRVPSSSRMRGGPIRRIRPSAFCKP
jgi:hypothetical protein